MIAEDVVDLYERLRSAGVRVWLVGGWGVDALLATQTRAHKDLDILVEVRDLSRLWAVLEGDGYVLQYLWPESAPVTDDEGAACDSAFVVSDANGREIDVHALTFDESGNPCPAWDAGAWTLASEDLAGIGHIQGVRVRCMSANMQLAVHAAYEPSPEVARSVALLHERFGTLEARLAREE